MSFFSYFLLVIVSVVVLDPHQIEVRIHSRIKVISWILYLHLFADDKPECMKYELI
jgi:hypothetical protein